MPRRTPLALAALVAAGALLAGCGAEDVAAGDRVDNGAQGVSEQGYVSGDGTITIVAEDDRVPAPELTGTTLDGTEFSGSDTVMVKP